MRILKKLTRFIYGTHLITYSQVTGIFTKYGSYRMQAYQDNHQEHLVIMSQNFSTLHEPIVYVHSDLHRCDPHDPEGCHCNNQMDMALKMIQKEGGVIVYSSSDGRSIDGLLSELKSRKLGIEEKVMTKAKINLNLHTTREYQSIGFILNHLSLSRIKLISSDLGVVHVADQLGINITKRTPAIAFGYGD